MLTIAHVNFLIAALLAKDANGVPILNVPIANAKIASESLDTLLEMQKQLAQPDKVIPIKSPGAQA